MRPVRKADNLTTILCRCQEIWERHSIIIIIIIIIIVIISFMQGICTYIPETNNVPRE
jgi:hypothetical protein